MGLSKIDNFQEKNKKPKQEQNAVLLLTSDSKLLSNL